MSTTTMLQLVQQATNELGVPTPTTVAGNTNQDVTQILALIVLLVAAPWLFHWRDAVLWAQDNGRKQRKVFA